MIENLVIVESPAKAKTIEKFLGKDFAVKSSYGHIRDLMKKNLSIEIENDFRPVYEIPDDKKRLVSELKKAAKEAKMIWLASDEDREGEAISWHLYQVLDLEPNNTQRIVFHEITKNAILHAVKNPRKINQDLVDAQQARRVLDRLVGFELSPILWKKIKPSLSAGRVQSVAVRLIVEREREIINFNSTSSFKVVAIFKVADIQGNTVDLKAEHPEKFKTKAEALTFLTKCKGATFQIVDIETKPAKRTPAPPFTTSTLQQEASRKFSFPVGLTMSVAQKLYEEGKITYMRTDSVNLSDAALNAIKEVINNEFGDNYLKIRQYKTKSLGAQEAHEAIRPAYMDKQTVSGSEQEKKLYDLIWKRTIASQMADAQLERTNVTIGISTCDDKLIATGEIIKFDGFLKVYSESTDEEKEEGNSGILPPLKVKQLLNLDNITATERYSHASPRYTEASLVKKLEELGIGRPSTYAPTISTVQQRGYVIKENREGIKRDIQLITLKDNKISEKTKHEITGAEKNKLFPTDMGMVVNDFLTTHFSDILDFNFTASVEKEFDEIAEGNLEWHKMIRKFYTPFHNKVEVTMETSERNNGMRMLGLEPKTGKPVSVRIGRFGPMVQIGEANNEKDSTDKPRFASLRKGLRIETITLEEALDLFNLPRTIGVYEDKEVSVGIGRFGPYIKHDNKFISLKKEDDPLTIDLCRAIELMEEKREADRNKVIKTFEQNTEIQILNGRWGPYISYQKENLKIPKTQDPKALTYEECLKLIGNVEPAKPKAKTTTKLPTSRKKK